MSDKPVELLAPATDATTPHDRTHGGQRPERAGKPPGLSGTARNAQVTGVIGVRDTKGAVGVLRPGKPMVTIGLHRRAGVSAAPHERP